MIVPWRYHVIITKLASNWQKSKAAVSSCTVGGGDVIGPFWKAASQKGTNIPVASATLPLGTYPQRQVS